MTFSSSKLNDIGNLYESIVENVDILNEATPEEKAALELRKNVFRQAQSATKKAQQTGGYISRATGAFITGKTEAERNVGTAKPKPTEPVGAQGLGLPSVQQFFNPKWWAPDRPSTQSSAKPKPSSQSQVQANIERNLAARAAAQKDPASYFGTNIPSPTTTKPSPRPSAPSTTPTRPSATPLASRPSATPLASKPSPRPPAPSTTLTRTPATPPAPTLSPMDAWKRANPKLAAASAERERIRGTSQTDNPLMKDMRSRLPAPTSTQAPDFKKTMTSGKYKDQGFQRLTQNIKSSYEYDAFDLVLEYLLSQGHVESLDEALYVMMEMNVECIQSIIEGDPSFQIKRSTGAGALTPNAAAQLGPKAVELQRKKASEVDLPDLKQSPSSMIRGV